MPPKRKIQAISGEIASPVEAKEEIKEIVEGAVLHNKKRKTDGDHVTIEHCKSW
jgi:hypothetical protein